MVENIKTTPWLSLKRLVDIDKGVDTYFSHEERCNGQKVAILPFRKTSNGLEFILRNEFTPCWDIDNHTISTLTGSVEKYNPLETSVIELKEESGYIAKEEEMIYLGKLFGIKSSDTIYYLYAVDCTNKEKGEATGDGSLMEEVSFSFWTNDITECCDPFAYTILIKLLKYFKDKKLK